MLIIVRSGISHHHRCRPAMGYSSSNRSRLVDPLRVELIYVSLKIWHDGTTNITNIVIIINITMMSKNRNKNKWRRQCKRQGKKKNGHPETEYLHDDVGTRPTNTQHLATVGRSYYVKTVTTIPVVDGMNIVMLPKVSYGRCYVIQPHRQ